MNSTTDSCISQQPKVARTCDRLQPMVDIKYEFSVRLTEAMADAGIVDERARSGALAKFTGLSRSAVSKWLRGESLPQTERIFELAIKYNVASEWLATGRGAKKPPITDYSLHNKNVVTNIGHRINEPSHIQNNNKKSKDAGAIQTEGLQDIVDIFEQMSYEDRVRYRALGHTFVKPEESNGNGAK